MSCVGVSGRDTTVRGLGVIAVTTANCGILPIGNVGEPTTNGHIPTHAATAGQHKNNTS